jgi:hypothetical protein
MLPVWEIYNQLLGEVIDQLTHGPLRLEMAKLMGATDSTMHAARPEPQLEEQLAWLSRQKDLWLASTGSCPIWLPSWCT